MKRLIGFLALLAVLVGLAAVSANAETAEEPASEWTVLVYFCGSDLESKYSYATGNLKEIKEMNCPDSLIYILDPETEQPESVLGKVNVLMETGGSTQWHAQEVGMDIRTDAVQRWEFRCASWDDIQGNRFELIETIPLASMCDPETLADFIRWGVRTYPAKKYALVLWSHGGGALTGLFGDELFSGDVMYLYELKQALAGGGVNFEALIMDACMMANLETATAVKDYARWMVASEEEVPGKGTAIGKWLEALYACPVCDGKQLGRMICDMTMIKYNDEENKQAQSTLTWSVIDLSAIGRLNEVADRYFRMLGRTLTKNSFLVASNANLIIKSEEYGNGTYDMRDFTTVFYNKSSVHTMDPQLRNDMLHALSDAVVYSIRGSGRTQAMGLSFCFPTDCSREELNIYAENYPNPYYLAFLDAITDWEAPEEVYRTTERLPEIDTLEAYQVTATRCMSKEGIPALIIDGNINNVIYRLYRQDEMTEQVIMMGRTDCVIQMDDEGKFTFYANEPWQWPAIEGTPCTMELVMQQYRENEIESVYNIPIQIGTDVYFLRCARIDSDEEGTDEKRGYEVYGIWEGYNQTSQVTTRGVIDLSTLAGQEYRVIWPLMLTGKNSRSRYLPSQQKQRMYRAITVEETTLPAGTYYLEYEIEDMFQRPCVLEWIEFHWDGRKITLQEDVQWEGSFQVKWSGN